MALSDLTRLTLIIVLHRLSIHQRVYCPPHTAPSSRFPPINLLDSRSRYSALTGQARSILPLPRPHNHRVSLAFGFSLPPPLHSDLRVSRIRIRNTKFSTLPSPSYPRTLNEQKEYWYPAGLGLIYRAWTSPTGFLFEKSVMVMMMDLDEDEYQHHSDGLDGASSLRRLNRLRESGTRSETGGVEGAPSATSTGATFAPTPGPLANPIASFPSFASSSASHSSFVGRPIDQEDIEVTSNNTILTTLSTHRHHSTHLPHIPTTEHNRSISIIPAPTSTLRPDQTGATADEHSEGGQKRLLSIKALLAQPPPYPHTSTSGLNRDNDDHNNDDHEGEKTKTRDYNYTRSSPSSGLELPIIRPSSITRKHRPQPIPTVPIPISTSPRPSSGPILNPQSYSASRRSPYPLSSLRDRFSHSASHSQSHSPFVNSAARSSPNSRAMSTTSLTPPPGGLTPPLQIQMDNHLEPSTSSYVPLASAPGSMSSRRRHAKPDWPSPKSSVRSSSSQRDRDRDRDREANPYSALQTPAILRVPATPFYSPAYRQASGSTAHPSLAHTNSAPGGVPTSPLPIPGIGAGTGVATRQDISIPATGRVHLTDVSKAHVIAALNKRAGQFWSSPESSDCRICEWLLSSPWLVYPTLHSAVAFSSTDFTVIPTPRRDNRSPKPIHTPQTVSALPVSTDVAAQPSSSDVPRAKDQGSGPPNAGETSDAGTGRGGSLPGGEDIPVSQISITTFISLPALSFPTPPVSFRPNPPLPYISNP